MRAAREAGSKCVLLGIGKAVCSQLLLRRCWGGRRKQAVHARCKSHSPRAAAPDDIGGLGEQPRRALVPRAARLGLVLVCNQL